MKIGELLAPAGSKTAAIAAINAGADAVYLGGRKFGARAFAENFSNDDLKELIRYAHLRQTSVFVTVNTIVYDDEMEELIAYADFLVENDVDALIIQDLGVLDLFLHRYPNTPIHASTQMNIHCVEQAKFLAGLGVSRIILARETPLSTIREIRRLVDIELEVFVHGAICVSYSGNCLFSSLVGGRSGNRGECAQGCRLPYTLMKDGEAVSGETFLMSPKDLMTVERLGELVAAGIAAFKIEGRMRKPEYVAQTVSTYRKALDAVAGGPAVDFPVEIDRLKRVFNREYTEGYLFGISPASINNPFRPNHMGIEVGTVISFERGKVTIRLSDTLAVNDGIRFLGETDTGDVVSRIIAGEKLVTRAFAGETIVLDSADPVAVGAKVMKTLDHRLEIELAVYQDEHYKKIGLKGVVTARVGEPFRLTVTDSALHRVEAVAGFAIPAATNRPVGIPEIRDQVGKLGNTPFFWESLEIDADGAGFIPVKTMNETRREAIEQLTLIRTAPRRLKMIVEVGRKPVGFHPRPFVLVAKVRTIEQLDAAWAKGIKTIYYEEIMTFDKVHYPGAELILQKLRIRRNRADIPTGQEFLASELSNMDRPFIADLFFNVTNIHAIHFLGTHGARSVTLSAELSQERIRAIATNYQAFYGERPALEIVAYGWTDLMISRYCPIAKTFGANPGCTLCERNQYHLKDRLGYEFPLVNDGECNIRVLNSRALNLIDFIEFFKLAGLSAVRLDFTIETAEETRDVITAFQKAILKQSYVVNRYRSTHGRFLK